MFKTIYTSLLRIFVKILFARNKNIQIVAVTGSMGKTTYTKLATKILQTKYKVKSSFSKDKGLNSETGIPFALLNIEPITYNFRDWIIYISKAAYAAITIKFDYDILILEFGVDKPNDMNYLLSLLPKVDVATFTGISTVHGENFENISTNVIEAIYKEKLKLFTLGKPKYSILNMDDSLISQTELNSKVYKYSTHDNSADIYAKTTENNSGEITINGTSHTIHPQHFLLSDGLLQTILGSVQTALLYDIDISVIIKTISKYKLPPGRLNLYKGINSYTLIDGSYNSSPSSLKDALIGLGRYKQNRYAILGDMRELGKNSKKEHKNIAKYVYNNTDGCLLIGPEMNTYVYTELQKLNYKGNLTSIPSPDGLLPEIPTGSVILIKSSQNTLFLERYVEMLLLNKTDLKSLCRRDDLWEKKREEIYKS